MARLVDTWSSSGPASIRTPPASRCSRIIMPSASRPTRVLSVTGSPRRARPRATLAGLPPGCAVSVRPPRCPTRSTSASPTTTNIALTSLPGSKSCRPVRARLAPAVPHAEADVLGWDALGGVGGDQFDARVLVAAGLRPAALGVGERLDPEPRHVLRVLLGGRVDDARADAVLDRVAPAVDGDEDDVLVVAAGGFERLGGAERRGLVDRVDDVDPGILGEQPAHRVLAPCRLTQRVGRADDLGAAIGDAEAAEEPVVAQHAAGDPRREVQHGDPGLDAELLNLGLRVPADQLAGLQVVGRVERVDRGERLGGRVQSDDGDAGAAHLLYRRHDG